MEAAPRGSPAWAPAGALGGRPSPCCPAARSCSPLYGVLLSADPAPYCTQILSHLLTWRCVSDCCGGCSPGVSSLSPSWSSGWAPLSLLPSSRIMLTSPRVLLSADPVPYSTRILSHLLTWRCVSDCCGGCSPGVSSLSPSWSSGWAPLSLLPSSRVMLTSPRVLLSTDPAPYSTQILSHLLTWRCVGCSRGVSSLSPSWSSGWAKAAAESCSLLHGVLLSADPAPYSTQILSHLLTWRCVSDCCGGCSPGVSSLSPSWSSGWAQAAAGSCSPLHGVLLSADPAPYSTQILSHLLTWRCVSDCCGGCSPGVSSLSPSWSSGWAPLSLLPSSRVMLTSPRGVAVRRSSTLQYTDIIIIISKIFRQKNFLWRHCKKVN